MDTNLNLEPFSAHSEFVRRTENTKCAVMLIHGILSTPKFFRDFVRIIPEEISVYNVLLDGHGKNVEDFSATSMQKWKEQVHGIFDGLSTRYEKIILVGHSMGTLFSIDLAIRHPAKVKSLFLMASPLKVFVKPITAKYSYKVIFEKNCDKNPIEISAKETYGIAPDKRLWKYIPWAPRFIELLTEIRRIRKLIPQLSTPTIVFQSQKDELVSIRSSEFFRDNPNVQLYILETSSHQHHTPFDKRILLESFAKMLETINE